MHTICDIMLLEGFYESYKKRIMGNGKYHNVNGIIVIIGKMW